MTGITRRDALTGATAAVAVASVPIAALANTIELTPRTLGLAEERRVLERQMATGMREMCPLADRVNEITRLLGDGEERRRMFMKEFRS